MSPHPTERPGTYARPAVLSVGTAALALLLAMAPAPASALPDEPSWPPHEGWTAAGTRVRVTARSGSGDRLVGWIHEWKSDSLVIARDPSRAHVPLPRLSVTRIETSGGVRGHAVRGAFLGFFVGAFAGTFVAASVSDFDPYGVNDDGDAEAFLLSWAATAVACTIVGGILGGSQKTERWDEVYEP
ncbi:MAG TPA: hypothetical protein VFP58_05985 [Candidatus Eisenbacteria bacterium]|nr:hypothetical protein [Candidatus Eisenbacteria bacterium]